LFILVMALLKKMKEVEIEEIRLRLV